MAQSPPPGPVHFPPPVAANTSAPSSAPSPAPATSPASPNAAAATDIHDIRGVISIPAQWLWAFYLAGGVALAAALYAAWRLFRRRVTAQPKLPHEIALERLEAARALMTATTVRDYAFTVSEIIRVYIERRFGERAARRTTEEFLFDLLRQTGTPLAQHRRLLDDFLNHCDLSKYARWQLTDREMESMHESARVFILDTQPQPEPAKPIAPVQPELLHAK